MMKDVVNHVVNAFSNPIKPVEIILSNVGFNEFLIDINFKTIHHILPLSVLFKLMKNMKNGSTNNRKKLV